MNARCLECGAEFEPKRTWRKQPSRFCSANHSKKWHGKRNTSQAKAVAGRRAQAERELARLTFDEFGELSERELMIWRRAWRLALHRGYTSGQAKAQRAA